MCVVMWFVIQYRNIASSMSELHCIVSGRVQGIGYRQFVQNIARELRIHGFVANLPDGSVEVLAQGDLPLLKVFANHIAKGPEGSTVRGFYDEWGVPQKMFDDFVMI